jgi:hypothetical protein
MHPFMEGGLDMAIFAFVALTGIQTIVGSMRESMREPICSFLSVFAFISL